MATAVYPLVFVRKTVSYPVPPVCSAFWTAEDWAKTARTTTEPLVLDALGFVWTATGERDASGKLLYAATKGTQ
jgi:hypothetical protein